MITQRYFLLFFSTIFLLGMVFSLEVVSPETYDGNVLMLYPNSGVTISFLNQEFGLPIFIDDVICKNVVCGEIKENGPYYYFDVNGKYGSGEIGIKYHLKGKEKEKIAQINVNSSLENLSVLILLPPNVEFLQKTSCKVFVSNNSDLKLSGNVFSNFPNNVFFPMDFSIDAKTKKYFETYFYPKNPGYYNIIFYLNVYGSVAKQKLAEQTLKTSIDLKNFFSQPTKSFFATNPILSMYSSIIYFISKLA